MNSEKSKIESNNIDPEKSKTISIAFKVKNTELLSKIILNGNVLPWNNKVNHLGYTLTSDCTSGSDIQNKRAAFISRQYSLNQEFAFASHEKKLKICEFVNLN